MKLTEAKKTVKTLLPKLRDAMRLDQWWIDVFWRKPEPVDHMTSAQTIAVCEADPNYSRAMFEVDHEAFTDAEHLLDTLRHELCHILHADFQTYRKAVAAHVSGKAFDALDVVFSRACEGTVFRIERMLNCMNLTPQKMIALSEKGRR